MAKKKKEKKQKDAVKKEEVCETFKIEKNGKEETIKSCGIEEEKLATKEQADSQNKTLKKVIILIACLASILIIAYFAIVGIRHFEYKGVEFEIVKEGKIILYRTSIPVMYNGKPADYNFYLRNDPRKLDDIPFDGKIILVKDMVINMSGSDFNCEGYGIIGVANFVKLNELLGVKVMRDENATCDSQGRYMHVQIQPGEITKITQTGQVCYTIEVKDCEILKATEKMMVEIFVRYNEVYKK